MIVFKSIKYLFKAVAYYVQSFLIVICQKILGVVPKKRNLLLFTAWFGDRYADNTMFLYEYLLGRVDLGLDLCWMTSNKKVYYKLISEDKPVVFEKTLKGIITQIRAKILFATVGIHDFNPILMSNCILVELGHGYSFKDPGESYISDESIKRNKLIYNAIDYHGFYVSSLMKKRNQYMRKYKNYITLHSCDFIRNDVYYDKKLREGKNLIVNEFKEHNMKVITYMPTHRSDGKKKINLLSIMNINSIQNICEKNDCIFIIKKHYYHRNEVENLDNYPNIFDITNIDDIDSQVLLFQTDVLISDYSAAFIEFLLLDRPIILYHYDIEMFMKEERKFIFNFNKLNLAPMPRTSKELSKSIEDILTSGIDQFSVNRNKFRNLYFDNPVQGNGRKMATEILCNLLGKNSHNY